MTSQVMEPRCAVEVATDRAACHGDGRLGALAPSVLGFAFLAVQAVIVLMFAELECVGLRPCAIVAG